MGFTANVKSRVLSALKDPVCGGLFQVTPAGARICFDRIDIVMDRHVPTLRLYYRGDCVSMQNIEKYVGPYDTLSITDIEGSSRLNITFD